MTLPMDGDTSSDSLVGSAGLGKLHLGYLFFKIRRSRWAALQLLRLVGSLDYFSSMNSI